MDAVLQNNCTVERRPRFLFAPPRIEIDHRTDGAQILRSPMPLGPIARCAGDWLLHWAKTAPRRAFLRERVSNEAAAPWREVDYREAHNRVERYAAGLLALGLNAERPLAILSDNSIDHALLTLAALHAGVPVSSISPAYSLVSRDHEKLKAIISALTPGAIFVSDAAVFGPALSAAAPLHDAAVLSGSAASGTMTLDALAARGSAQTINDAFASVGLDTIAKVLFTSGSTGMPKGVINTQRMLTASQQARAQTWPFVETSPPRILDWLPWSHTFGANHNFNLVLRNGGTLTIDNGKPAPGLFARTLANVAEGPGNIYFNVPRGFDMLAAAMKADEALRDTFFENLQVIFYAGAALPQTIWDDLHALSIASLGEPVAMVSAWGSTETAPLATDCHFQAERSGTIGLPVPGVEIKLVPNGGKQEIRVRGPNVTPGYWRKPDATKAAFDGEGFYLIGDAVRFADPATPEKGLLFDGRVAEDFKLTTGTWVNVGHVRVKGIECLAPLAQDIVVTGHDRGSVGFLVFADIAAARTIAGLPEDAAPDHVLADPKVRAHVKAGLENMRAAGEGSSSYAAAALLMAEPPSVDGGEITDKGYVNQRAVLTRRADLAEILYCGGSIGVVRI